MKLISDELEEKLKNTDNLFQNQEKKNLELQQLLEKERESWQNKVRIKSQEREEELELIEKKVKNMIISKEEKIKLLTKQVEEAETREKKLEKFIERVESGIPEL